MRKANRSYVLEERIANVTEGLITLLFEIDLEIERLADLLNRAQRITPGKIGIQFIGATKIGGKYIHEPAIIRLVLLSSENKRWLARQIPKYKIDYTKLYLLLPQKKAFLKDGKSFRFDSENQKEVRALLKELGRLFVARKAISLELGRFSHLYPTLLKKTMAVIRKSQKVNYEFEIDFSQPKIAYEKLRERELLKTS